MKNAIKKLQENGLAGEVDRVELIIKKGASFKDKLRGIKDGYFYNKVDGETVELEGVEGIKNFFIKVVQL